MLHTRLPRRLRQTRTGEVDVWTCAVFLPGLRGGRGHVGLQTTDTFTALTPANAANGDDFRSNAWTVLHSALLKFSPLMGGCLLVRLRLKRLSVTEQQQGALDLLGFQRDQWGYARRQQSGTFGFSEPSTAVNRPGPARPRRHARLSALRGSWSRSTFPSSFPRSPGCSGDKPPP